MKNYKKIRFSLSIKTKLLLAFFVLIFIPLYFITEIGVQKIADNSQKNMKEASVKTLKQSVEYLNYKLYYVVNTIDIILYSNNFQSMFTGNPDKYDRNISKQAEDQKKIIENISSLKNNRDIFDIKIYIRNIPFYTYHNTTGFYIISGIKDTKWYNELTISENYTQWFPSYYFDYEKQQTPVIAITRLLFSIEQFMDLVGVLRIDVNKSTIDEIVEKINISQTGIAYIVNSNGEIISYSGNSMLLNNNDFRKAAEDFVNHENIKDYMLSNSDRYMIISTKVENTDWSVVSAIPFREINAASISFRVYMITLAGIIGLICCLIAYYMSGSISKRLELIGEGMQKVENGDFETFVNIRSNDEIGKISNSFNQMVKQMSLMTEEIFENGKRMKGLELNALQAQINPHFLYNTLDMINWTAIINGNKEIELTVQALSKFFKIALSKGHEVIKLKNEIEHVKAYVLIQNQRYMDAINFTINIPEELYDYSILKIIIQPIVENAIMHGILKKPEKKGRVNISAGLDGENLIITVIDDGVGVSLLDVKNTSNNDYHGYGVNNINERIKLFYGYEYGLYFESEPGHGAKVTVIIPAVKVEQ